MCSYSSCQRIFRIIPGNSPRSLPKSRKWQRWGMTSRVTSSNPFPIFRSLRWYLTSFVWMTSIVQRSHVTDCGWDNNKNITMRSTRSHVADVVCAWFTCNLNIKKDITFVSISLLCLPHKVFQRTQNLFRRFQNSITENNCLSSESSESRLICTNNKTTDSRSWLISRIRNHSPSLAAL